MQSFTHYNRLKENKDTINGQFEDTLGELKWEDSKKRIGFLDDTMGHVNKADTDQEFPWLHDRLIRLHEVFQRRCLGVAEMRRTDGRFTTSLGGTTTNRSPFLF